MGKTRGVHPAKLMFDDRFASWRDSQRSASSRVPFLMREGAEKPDIFAQIAQAKEERAPAEQAESDRTATPAPGGEKATWLYNGEHAVMYAVALAQPPEPDVVLPVKEGISKGLALGEVEFAGVKTGKDWGPVRVGSGTAQMLSTASFKAAKGKVAIVSHGAYNSVAIGSGGDGFFGIWEDRLPWLPDWWNANGITELIIYACTLRDPAELAKEKDPAKEIRTIAKSMAEHLVGLKKPVTAITPYADFHHWAYVGAKDEKSSDEARKELDRILNRYFAQRSDKKAADLPAFVREFGAKFEEMKKRGVVEHAFFDFYVAGKRVYLPPGIKKDDEQEQPEEKDKKEGGHDE